MAERTLKEIKWRDGEVLRVAISEYKGREYFGVRVWWEDKDGEFKPGKNGINVPLDEADTLLEVMQAGVAAINAKPVKSRKGK